MWACLCVDLSLVYVILTLCQGLAPTMLWYRQRYLSWQLCRWHQKKYHCIQYWGKKSQTSSEFLKKMQSHLAQIPFCRFPIFPTEKTPSCEDISFCRDNMCSSLHHTVSHKVTVKTESSNELSVTKPCQSFAPLLDYVYLNAIPWQLLTGYKTSWAKWVYVELIKTLSPL